MTTASVGPAVRAAAEDALRQLCEAASEVLEVPGTRLHARDGTIATEDGSASITFRSLCDRLGEVMILGRGSRGPNPSGIGLASFGAQFADVEVDADTGVVRVLRIVAVHDAGRIVNPTLAESQVEGGIIQGLGFALFEERVLDAASGTMPRRANTKPNLALVDAMRMSIGRVMVTPRPAAAPRIALAATGCRCHQRDPGSCDTAAARRARFVGAAMSPYEL